MKKIVAGVIIAGMTLLFFGCPPADSPPLSRSESQQMMTEATTLVYMELMSAITRSSRGSDSIDYHNDDWTVVINGTYTWDDDNTYPMTFTLSCVISDFVPVSATITLINGTLDSMITYPDESSFTYAYDGSLSIVYKGETYSSEWDFNISMSGSEFAYSGTYTINGYEYSW
jgi:hypothetical protein